jgi:hypothetical protein
MQPGKAVAKKRQRRCNALTCLKSTDLRHWTGTLVHEAIKLALRRLKAGRPMAEAKLIKQLRRRAEADFADSHSERYRQKPNQLTGFQEHYYQTDLPPLAWQEAQAQAEHYLLTFLNSALYAELRQQPPLALLAVEELQSFLVAGAKVWVQLDLVRRGNNTLYLYDWKSGLVDSAELHNSWVLWPLFAPCGRGVPLRAIVYLLAEDKCWSLNWMSRCCKRPRPC